MMCQASSTRKMRFLRSGRIQVCSSHTPTIAIRMGIAMELRSMCDRSKTISGESRSMPALVGPSNMPRRSPSTSRSSTRATSRPQARTSSRSTFIASADSGIGCRSRSTMSVRIGWRSVTVSATKACATFSAKPDRSSRPRPIATSMMVRSSASWPVTVIAGSSGLSLMPPSRAAIGSSRIGVRPIALAIRFHSPTPSSPCASSTTTCRSRKRSWRST